MIAIKRIARILLGVLALATYLNIGWAFGTYSHEKVCYAPTEELVTIPQRILAGPGEVFAANKERTKSLVVDQLFYSFLWPLIILLYITMWTGYGAYCVITWLLWLIFAGGIAKLLGAG